VRTLGRIDVLFNNAASAYFNWLEGSSDEEWDRSRRSEVDLVFYLTRAVWPFVRDRSRYRRRWRNEGLVIGGVEFDGVGFFS
jgi:NAD(P)-dependent dehydrogenase (short-subunit alcohol dehydrogenase family)